MISLSVRMINLSTRFRSSRTLPFQGYFIIISRASGENFLRRKLFSSE
ncbi:MAG: hypothetical protein ACPLRR_06145 [Candidatus Saccharicenans sp.]